VKARFSKLARLLLLAGVALLSACGAERDAGRPDGATGGGAERGIDERLERAEQKLNRARANEAETAGPNAASLGPRFEAFAATLDGDVGVAVGATRASPRVMGELRGGHAWSTIKVPIAMRVLADAGAPSDLPAGQRRDVERALTASDNSAAARLFGGLGSVDAAAAKVTRVLRDAGDRDTVVATAGRDSFSPYGQTDWSLAGPHRFMAALAGGCLGDRASREFVLALMGRVTSDRWGLGASDRPARWKGGWGPDPDGRYLARQMGVLEFGSRRLVVALAVRPHDGTLATAQRIASELARWAADHGEALAAPPVGC
jgi:hypothetical protein